MNIVTLKCRETPSTLGSENCLSANCQKPFVADKPKLLKCSSDGSNILMM